MLSSNLHTAPTIARLQATRPPPQLSVAHALQTQSNWATQCHTGCRRHVQTLAALCARQPLSGAFESPCGLCLRRIPMMRSFLLCALVAPAFGALELTDANFDDVVFKSGKAAFVKFLAPW